MSCNLGHFNPVWFTKIPVRILSKLSALLTREKDNSIVFHHHLYHHHHHNGGGGGGGAGDKCPW